MMSDFMRRPLRGLRLLVASAMLASFSVASPVPAMAAIPGSEPAGPSPITEVVDPVTDPLDVWTFTLAEGEFLDVTVSQSAEATTEVAVATLLTPNATSADDAPNTISSGTVTAGTPYTGAFTAGAGQAGDYYLAVAAQSGDTTYTVNWSKSLPTFSLQSTSTSIDVVQGTSSPNLSFQVNWGNLGAVPVAFTATSSQPWLSVDPASGSATSGASQQVTFSADATGLSLGSRQATITVDILGADPQTFTVSMNVLDPDTAEDDDAWPGITAPASPFEGSVDPVTDKRDVYAFPPLSEGQFLHVEVAQSAEATAVAALFGPGTTDVTNLSGALSSGDVSQQTSFTADVTAEEGEAGDYYLSVAAQSGTSTYTVDWSISNPTFSLATTTTAITAVKTKDATPRTFAVDWGEMGSEPVTFTVESDQPWLAVSPTTGEATSNTSTDVSLDASTTALPVGTYDATVTVGILGAAPRTHRVRVNVVEQPNMSISAYVGGTRVYEKPVAYGATVTFKGSLNFPGSTKLRGKPAVLQRYNGSEWVTAAVAATSTTGDYSANARVWANTNFRWRFAGDASFNETVSGPKKVFAYVSISRPAIPSRVRPNRSYTFYGYLKPQHPQNASAVKVQFQYYYKKRWRSDVTLPLKVYNVDSSGSKYRYADRYVRGVPVRWRVRAIHPGDANHATTYSSWEYYSVY